MSDNVLLRDLTLPLSITAAISSAAGLAAALRTSDRVTRAQIAGAVISSGVAGTIVGFLTASQLAENVTLWIGVSSLAGAGGASTLDLLLQLLRARVRRRPR